VFLNAGQSDWVGPPPLIGTWSAQSMSSRCIDVVDGTRNAHPLTITHSHNVLFTINGYSGPVVSFRWQYNGRPFTGLSGFSPASQPVPSDNTALLKGLIRSDPNRASVDLPVFLFELRELPRLLQDWADQIWRLKDRIAGGFAGTPWWELPRALASKNLEYQFGVLPFLQDLAKTMKWRDLVAKRMKQLDRLRVKGSVGGYVDVWDDSVIAKSLNAYLTPLYQESNKVNIIFETSRKLWVTTTWKSDRDLSQYFAGSDQEHLAWRLVNGTDISFATLWEAMPWSWLIDWFSNIGDLLQQTRNIVPVHHQGSCVMRHTQSRVRAVEHIAGPGIFTVSLPRAQLDEKTRVPWGSSAPLPEFNLPFLNGKQLSILGSLAVTRRSAVLLT
jgi:hypothetical protein